MQFNRIPQQLINPWIDPLQFATYVLTFTRTPNNNRNEFVCLTISGSDLKKKLRGIS